MVQCPADVASVIPIGFTGTTVTWDPPIVSDDSGMTNLVSVTRSPGDYFTVGMTDVTYTYSDNNGNTASCTFQVVVVECRY